MVKVQKTNTIKEDLKKGGEILKLKKWGGDEETNPKQKFKS